MVENIERIYQSKSLSPTCETHHRGPGTNRCDLRMRVTLLVAGSELIFDFLERLVVGARLASLAAVSSFSSTISPSAYFQYHHHQPCLTSS
jgi:hypothetical protein